MRALGLRDAIAFPQLIASPDGGVAVVEVAARIPGGQMADLVRHAVGVDLVEVALRQALGEEVPDEVALPRFTQPLADPLLHRPARPAAHRPGDPHRLARRGARLGGVVQAGHVPAARRDDPPRPAVTATAAATSSPPPTHRRRRSDRAELAATKLEVEVEAAA